MRTEWCPDCGQVFNPYGGHVCNYVGYKPRALCLHCKSHLDADGACRSEACVRSKTGEVQEALSRLYAVSVPPPGEVEEPVKLHALAPHAESRCGRETGGSACPRSFRRTPGHRCRRHHL